MTTDEHILIHGDCLEEMQKLERGSVDLVLTDPPYGTTSCKWDTVIPLEQIWNIVKKIRKEKTPIALFGSEPFSSFLRMSNIKEFKYDWIWDKSNCGNPFLAKYQPLKEHEIVSVFYKKAGNYYPIKQKRTKESLKRRASKDDWHGVTTKICAFNDNGLRDLSRLDPVFRNPRSIQKFNLDTAGGSRKRFHPTQKPVALLEYLIKTYTKPGETVLDFTMGSGSTGVACINTGRKFIGIEKDDEYFDVAKNRIEDAISKKQQLLL
jgi:DNA modification methylase